MPTRSLLSLAFAILASSATVWADAAERVPNFIIVMADDCSAKEFGCYGNVEAQTPRLDELAATGVMFKTAWCAPICSPSRAMMMTGRYAFRTGWYHNDMKPSGTEPGADLSRNHLIFAQVLKQAGYRTAICGKWQLGGTERDYGFEEACMHHAIKGQFTGPIEPPEGNLPGRPARYWHPAVVRDGKQLATTEADYGPDIYTDFVLDFAARHRQEPFLVYYPMSLTHITWDFDRKKMGYVAPPELDADGNKTGRKGEPTLAANVTYTDHLMGRIVDGLDELGIREDTIFLFTCDNGTAGYGKGNAVEERGPRVPMIVNCPGRVKALGPSDALVGFVDVFATLVDLSGASLPEDYVLDGVSFGPVLDGSREQVRPWLFSYLADQRMLRDTRWLLDGRGHFFDCGDRRDEQGYRDVTDSDDPEVKAALARFRRILEDLPAPDPDDPVVKHYEEKQAQKRQRRKKTQAAWEKKYGEGK